VQVPFLEELFLSFYEFNDFSKLWVIFFELEFDRCELLSVLSSPVNIAGRLVYQFYEIFL